MQRLRSSRIPRILNQISARTPNKKFDCWYSRWVMKSGCVVACVVLFPFLVAFHSQPKIKKNWFHFIQGGFFISLWTSEILIESARRRERKKVPTDCAQHVGASLTPAAQIPRKIRIRVEKENSFHWFLQQLQKRKNSIALFIIIISSVNWKRTSQ